MRSALLLVPGLFAVGCAGAGDPNARPDAPGDAAVDDAPDAEARPDACVTQTMQLLANPAFDLDPAGTGWTQEGGSLVRADGDPAAPQTAPYYAWLGGDDNITDALWQEFQIPPLTSKLVLSGSYDIRSEETTATTKYDTALLLVTSTTDQQIAAILDVSNLDKTTAWTAFSHTFSQNLSEQTVRLRFKSKTDGSKISSFYLDSLDLTATYGCPSP